MPKPPGVTELQLEMGAERLRKRALLQALVQLNNRVIEPEDIEHALHLGDLSRAVGRGN